jgi:SH3 domain protein
MRKPVIVLVGLWLLSGLSVSQAAYITDKLVAGLYEEPEVSDKPLKALNSGTPLEVVSRKNGFVNVRTSDGTLGWVEATYLTDEKPARSILLDTQAKVSILQKQLEQLKGQLADSPGNEQKDNLSVWQEKLARAEGQISQLEIQLKAAKLNNKKADESQQAVNQENQQLRDQIARVAAIVGANIEAQSAISPETVKTGAQKSMAGVFSNDMIWILLVIGLVLGFVAGFYYMRFKVSQRFGNVIRL